VVLRDHIHTAVVQLLGSHDMTVSMQAKRSQSALQCRHEAHGMETMGRCRDGAKHSSSQLHDVRQRSKWRPSCLLLQL
jgi:hypothetical protein